MTLVEATAPVLDIEAEAVEEDLRVAPRAEEDELDGVGGHDLVRVRLLEDDAAVIGQGDGQDDGDGLRPEALLAEDVHLAVGLDLADGGVDGGGAQVGDAAKEHAHDGGVVRVQGEGGGERGGDGAGLRGRSWVFVTYTRGRDQVKGQEGIDEVK